VNVTIYSSSVDKSGGNWAGLGNVRHDMTSH